MDELFYLECKKTGPAGRDGIRIVGRLVDPLGSHRQIHAKERSEQVAAMQRHTLSSSFSASTSGSTCPGSLAEIAAGAISGARRRCSRGGSAQRAVIVRRLGERVKSTPCCPSRAALYGRTTPEGGRRGYGPYAPRPDLPGRSAAHDIRLERCSGRCRRRALRWSCACSGQ
jgi:hypothetical protein